MCVSEHLQSFAYDLSKWSNSDSLERRQKQGTAAFHTFLDPEGGLPGAMVEAVLLSTHYGIDLG
jgi:hypothetical protein